MGNDNGRREVTGHHNDNPDPVRDHDPDPDIDFEFKDFPVIELCLNVVGVLFLVGVISVLFGCTTNVAPIKLPEKQCQKLEMPPLPQLATITIRGDQVMADTGGEEILRYYVAARRTLK